MRGMFRFATPETADLTLSVTATLKEWREVHKQLGLNQPSGPADVLARQVVDLIRSAEKTLAQGSWTTGYATGEERDEA